MKRLLAGLAGTLLLLEFGCAQPAVPEPEEFGAGETAVLAETATAEPAAPSAAGTPVIGSTSSGVTTMNVSGSVNSGSDYRLYDLGAGRVGDRWIVTPSSFTSGSLVLALFDADMNLLYRGYSAGEDMDHTLRADTAQVIVGVAPVGGGRGGSFDLTARRYSGSSVPPPRAQTVYLNFAATQDVRVHTHAPVSFAAFDSAMTGAPYAGKTAEMKAAILAAMQADYARYNVNFVSSDVGPPAGAYTIVHFGGEDGGLLGLADDVDSYNQDETQGAIVFVSSFALYQDMGLTLDEMALMVANVASHELGHLLGLYHTQAPDDLMDTTGTAWDLAEDQAFLRAELETSVFPVGMEDSPRLLEQTLGPAPFAAAKVKAAMRPVKGATYKALRDFTRKELRHTCGTCAALDR